MDLTLEAGPSSKILLVPKAQLGFVWPGVEVIIRNFGRRGLLDFVDLEELKVQLWAGDYHLWLAIDEDGILQGIAICAPELHRFKSNYHVVWIGGEYFSKFINIGITTLEQYSSVCGFGTLVFQNCRPGLIRKLKPFGYAPNMQQVQKSVSVMWSEPNGRRQ